MGGNGTKKRIWIMIFFSTLLVYNSPLFASNIDPDNSGNRYSYGENIGWFNLSPSLGGGVTVEDDKLTGYIWAENIGWIKLDPAFGGVVHDGQGNLSGYGWSENCGWINFSCTTNDTCRSVSYGVTIDTITGLFTGYGWGENIGWIRFDFGGFTGAPDYHAQTSWRMDGDVDSDGLVTLSDAVLTLKILAGYETISTAHAGADITGDGRIGLGEASSILLKLSN